MLNQNLLLAGDDSYNLSKSLRFRSSASAYLNRTPASAGNQQKWTWSGWVKRGSLGITANFISAGTADATRTGIAFTGSDTIFIYHGTAGPVYYGSQTTPVFRDCSAWYHLVVSADTTQATAANRIQIYINGVLQVSSAYSAGYIAQNTNTYLNAANGHAIGSNAPYSIGAYMDGYQTEINLIDGQALTPSSFGETDPTTGVWKPKKYAGTYGTNGFYLPFTDVATTSGSNAGLGKDFSGNGNYWNTNNISVTAGATYDSMKDVPTLTDADTANYCVMNPLRPSSYGAATLSEGNLKVSQSAGAYVSSTSTFPMSAGSWYWEVNCGTAGFVTSIGIASTISANGAGASGTWCYHYDGTKYVNGSNSAYGASYTGGDVLGFAFNASAGSLTCYKNGTSQGVLASGLSAGDYYAFVTLYNSNNVSFNFGQRPFAYTPPTGFKSLNTYNLPAPTIGSTASTLASKNFDATLYTGNGSTQSIVNAGGFQPDMVWIKARSNAYNHYLFDSVRGATKYLSSNQTIAEGTNANMLNAFNSNGFSLGYDTEVNGGSVTEVAWQWKANGSAVSNTAGSITSQVSANPSAGFSVVTWTGTTGGGTIGHGLGVAPKMIITKSRSAVSDWLIYHSSLGNTNYIYLNLTNATGASAVAWNNTSPTSSVFSTGTYYNTGNWVAYCFSEVAGYSKFGSYTGNGSADGPFVHLGFRPAFVMMKRSDSGTNSWVIKDKLRTISANPVDGTLYAESSVAEATGSGGYIDFVSNGFKVRATTTDSNASGGTYIYMAFAENPFKNSLAR